MLNVVAVAKTANTKQQITGPNTRWSKATVLFSVLIEEDYCDSSIISYISKMELKIIDLRICKTKINIDDPFIKRQQSILAAESLNSYKSELESESRFWFRMNATDSLELNNYIIRGEIDTKNR